MLLSVYTIRGVNSEERLSELFSKTAENHYVTAVVSEIKNFKEIELYSWSEERKSSSL